MRPPVTPLKPTLPCEPPKAASANRHHEPVAASWPDGDADRPDRRVAGRGRRDGHRCGALRRHGRRAARHAGRRGRRVGEEGRTGGGRTAPVTFHARWPAMVPLAATVGPATRLTWLVATSDAPEVSVAGCDHVGDGAVSQSDSGSTIEVGPVEPDGKTKVLVVATPGIRHRPNRTTCTPLRPAGLPPPRGWRTTFFSQASRVSSKTKWRTRGYVHSRAVSVLVTAAAATFRGRCPPPACSKTTCCGAHPGPPSPRGVVLHPGGKPPRWMAVAGPVLRRQRRHRCRPVGRLGWIVDGPAFQGNGHGVPSQRPRRRAEAFATVVAEGAAGRTGCCAGDR